MPEDPDCLSGPEIRMLIEGLDALILGGEGNDYWLKAGEVEKARWEPYRLLRRRLKAAIHMSFFDSADTWLEEELRRERLVLTESLHVRLVMLLNEPRASRNSIRAGFVAASRELRESRQSRPKPLS